MVKTVSPLELELLEVSEQFLKLARDKGVFAH